MCDKTNNNNNNNNNNSINNNNIIITHFIACICEDITALLIYKTHDDWMHINNACSKQFTMLHIFKLYKLTSGSVSSSISSSYIIIKQENTHEIL